MYRLAPEGLKLPLYGFKSWIVGTSFKVKQVFLNGKGVASLTIFILCVILYNRNTVVHNHVHVTYTTSEQNNSMPSREKLNSMPSREKLNSMPTGDTLNSMPTGEKLNSMPSGDKLNFIPTGDKLNSMPSREQLKSMPTGDKHNSMPTGDKLNSMPSRKKLKSMPTGDKLNSMPTGDKLDSMPSRKKLKSMPTGDKLNSMPTGDKLNSMPSRKKINSMPTGDKLNSMPSREKLNSMPTGDKLLPNVDGRLQSKLVFVGKEPVVSENCKKRFPDAIIIGVMKGGTEAFSTFLAIHPQVAMQFEMRSTLFFTSNFNKGFNWYKEQMPCREEGQVTVEKSQQYWPGKTTPSLIHKFNPNIKLILIVRNPIDRSVSHFLQQLHSNPQKLTGKTFEKNILTKSGHLDTSSDVLHLSAYSVVLKNWLKYFKLKQILVIDGDNFRENPAKELSRAERFLNIKPFISPDNFKEDLTRNVSCIKRSDGEQSCLPMGKGRTHPALNPGVQIKLMKYFTPYNKEFFKMTGMNFHWSA